jgi:hypothetical protein
MQCTATNAMHTGTQGLNTCRYTTTMSQLTLVLRHLTIRVPANEASIGSELEALTVAVDMWLQAASPFMARPSRLVMLEVSHNFCMMNGAWSIHAQVHGTSMRTRHACQHGRCCAEHAGILTMPK